MATEIEPLRTEAEYEAALAEVDRLWGAKLGTADGDRLDQLSTRIVDYEDEHYPLAAAENVEQARLDAEGLADVAAGRVIPHDQVAEWLARLAKGEKVPPPCPWKKDDPTEITDN
jgi:HTH-type transcriptional regulator/antitoxin HigA